MASSTSPVWDVYDLFRTARLNVKYYTGRLLFWERVNLISEIIMAISAPSSAIAGLWFLETPIGALAWKYFGVLTAFISLVKPMLKLTKKIKNLEEIVSGYKGLEHDLHEITIMINQKKQYDSTLQKEFQNALKRKGVLVKKEPEHWIDKKFKKTCESEVLTELPVSSFFIPKESTNDRSKKTTSSSKTANDTSTNT